MAAARAAASADLRRGSGEGRKASVGDGRAPVSRLHPPLMPDLNILWPSTGARAQGPAGPHRAEGPRRAPAHGPSTVTADCQICSTH